MLTPEQQAEFAQELPEVFVPIAGGWGRTGMTHIRLAVTNEDVLAGALRAGMETTDREERTDGREEARFGVARRSGKD